MPYSRLDYDHDLAKLSVDLLRSHGEESLKLLRGDALNSIANVYYRFFYVERFPEKFEWPSGQHIQPLLDIDVERLLGLQIRFIVELQHTKGYVDKLIDFLKLLEAKQSISAEEKTLRESLQNDLVDTFTYGIDEAHKKWGWTKSKERKKAIVFDIPNFLALTECFDKGEFSKSESSNGDREETFFFSSPPSRK